MPKKQLALLQRDVISVELGEGRYADDPYSVTTHTPYKSSYKLCPTLGEAISAFAAELARLPEPLKYTADTDILRERIAIALTLEKAREEDAVTYTLGRIRFSLISTREGFTIRTTPDIGLTFPAYRTRGAAASYLSRMAESLPDLMLPEVHHACN